jgi:DNA (cytosine-5)-methyltransferase 1
MSKATGSLLYHAPKPRLLDLFCGAGGAGTGYHRAGFDVVGVDIAPQKNYPFEFIQADVLEYMQPGPAWAWIERFDFEGFDAILASPPCQRHSRMSNCRPGLAAEYDDLISETRERLKQTGLPYVIENVPGAPLRADVTLCGQMFGLPLYRHRLFESNVPLVEPTHPAHVIPASKAGHWKPGTIISVSGHVAPIKLAREAMGIDWTTREELAEAIPPAYTEYVGAQLFSFIRQELAA